MIDKPIIESVHDLLQETSITCPYCWESIDIVIDQSSGESGYIEDCQVCCQPIKIDIQYHANGEAQLNIQRENE